MLKKNLCLGIVAVVLTVLFACDDSGNTTSASVNTPSVTKGSFADERDGKTYRTVTIGYQTWMAENLDYEMMNDSYCYEYNPDYCSKYGRLYNSIGLRYVCPSGWHLPSASEWGGLFSYIANYDSIKKTLNFEEKISAALMHASFVERQGGSVDTLNKILKEGYGSSITVDMFGFSALAAGMNRDGVYLSEGKLAVFWATDGCVTIPYIPYSYTLDSFCESIVMASVRCIQGPAYDY